MLPQWVVRQEKADNNMTTIRKMSWSLKNKPIKYYSIVTFLAFLFLMTIFKFKDEKRDRRTCDNLKKLETLSDIASNVGTCDILERLYSINVYATPIIIPDQLWVKVRSWLQEDGDLLKTATNQNVIHITNKVNTLKFRSIQKGIRIDYFIYLVKQLTTIHSEQRDQAQKYE